MKTILLLGAALASVTLSLVEGRSLTPRGRRHDLRHDTLSPELCSQRPESGRCYARMLMWFYNSTSETCERFTYGGCGGNVNRFWSRHACNKACSDPCSKPLEVGSECPVSAEEPTSHFYYDSSLNQCKPFMYLGCGGNGNRFWSLRQCERRCVEDETAENEETEDSSIVEDLFESEEATESDDDDDDDVPTIPERCRGRPMCRMFCRYGFQNGEDGCPICRCNRTPIEDEESVEEADGQDGDDESDDDDSVSEGCRTPVCYRPCKFGFQNNAAGCPICRCNPPPTEERDDEPVTLPEHCRDRPMCDRFCRYGFKTGSDGCPICKCNRPPRRNVPVIPEHCRDRPMCAMHCENGFQTGRDGCPICRCKPSLPSPTLPALPRHCRGQVMCRMYCKTGFQIGENGCPICRCNPPSPAETEVENISEERRAAPARGTRSVSGIGTYPSKCSRAMCRMYCRNGFETDSEGCPICRCVRDSVESDDNTDLQETVDDELEGTTDEESSRPRCKMPRCLMSCPNGYLKNRHGCPTCRCKGRDVSEEEAADESEDGSRRPRCPTPRCPNACPSGYKMNRRGCITCQCKVAEKPPRHCRPLACFAACPTGYRLRNGCPTCECRPEPERLSASSEQEVPLSDLDDLLPGEEREVLPIHFKAAAAVAGVEVSVRTTEDACSLPVEPGVCRGRIPRFYFDQDSGECEVFFYGGCGGNENNFRSLEACQQKCGGN